MPEWGKACVRTAGFFLCVGFNQVNERLDSNIAEWAPEE